jgi:cobalamin biosynthesis Mg chelatase CobN
VPPAEATPVNGFSPSSPIAKDVSPLTSDAMSTLGSMDNTSSETPSTSDTENAFSSSALNADISNSPMNLNQPLPDVTGNTFKDESSTPSQDVVNTLDKTDKSDGDSNVVVIILVVIIVLLLAGIGYFAYQIFLA